jgi:putative hydrolase of the HAD superfamily
VSQTLRSPKTICAVTFDAGGTLIEPYPSVGHIYSEVAARHGHKGISPVLLNRRFASVWQALKDFRYTRTHWAEVVDATFRGLTRERPSRSFFPELYHRFAEPDAWQVYEDVRPALAALGASGLKLGVISNWDERLRPLLRALKLNGYFDVIVVSCEVGAAKPARAIFRRAAAELRLVPETILHVGDGLEMDVQGARAAGLQSLLLRRTAKRRSLREIRSLDQLADFIYNRGPYA